MVMAPVNPQAAAQNAQNASAQPQVSFRRATRQQEFLQPPLTVTQFGQTVNFALPQSGFLSRIFLNFTGTITTGAGTPAGSWGTYPPLPYALIRKIRIYTTEGVEIINISGWGLFLHNMRRKRLQMNAQDLFSTFLNTNGRAALLSTNTGTPAASTAYTFTGSLEIPIYTDDIMMLGLLLLQSNDVRCNMEITFAYQADTGNVSGVTLTPAFNFTPMTEYFSLPQMNNAAGPNLQYVHSLYEEFFPFNNNGDVIYRPTPGNIFLSLSGIIENNGAQVATANINTLKVQYAQAVAPYYEQYVNALFKWKLDYGFVPPDGYFDYDFALGSGVPGFLDPRDWLDTSQQTDLQFTPNVSGLTLVNAQLRVVREQLARIG
jgi:hypothetical protein